MEFSCSIPGCSVALTSARYADRHTKQTHVECTCGWVGIYIRKHQAAMERKEDTREHRLLGGVGGLT
jgi:hypothetical protein